MLQDPLREWQERYSSGGTRLGFKPMGDTPFTSSVRLICDSPGVIRTTLSPGVVFRDRSMVRDGNDNRSLVVSLARDLRFWHRGREVALGQNEATILQNDEPGKAGASRQFAFYELSVPLREWTARAGRSDDVLMKVINRHSETLKLLLGYVNLLAKVGMPAGQEASATVRRHLMDLTVLATTECAIGESHADCVVVARRTAALEHIASHFHEPGLSGSSVARKLGISQRYLQRLLQETQKSFTEHVNELRLNRAFALLTAANSTARVSDIAFEAGFSDLAHFHRLFRVRFGDTPNGVRGTVGAPETNRT